MIFRLHNLKALITITLIVVGCGLTGSDDVKKYDKAHDGALTKKKSVEKAATTASFSCKKPKSNLEFASSLIEIAYNRTITETEKSEVSNMGQTMDRLKFVSERLSTTEVQSGVAKFVANLLRLNKLSINPNLTNEDRVQDAVLVADLQKEPIELVLRNLDKPWSYFFTTRDIPCTKNTAKLYDYPETESGAFVACRMQDDRAGFLGLASVLRANTSSVISTNNNYHRVAFALYLAQGFKLLDATNGPAGTGTGMPLPGCVPVSDIRVAQGGLVYGTAAIPAVGPVCASCHSRHNGPLSVAFRRFRPDGGTYSFAEIDRIGNGTLGDLGTSREQIKFLMNETTSCWSADGIAPPQMFNGIPGLGELIVRSGTLGDALGIQIPKMLANIETDSSMQSSIKKYYLDGKQTLLDALKGFFLSESFQCAEKGE